MATNKLRRQWICPKCGQAFPFVAEYGPGTGWFSDITKQNANFDLSRQIAQKRIHHKELGCNNDKPESSHSLLGMLGKVVATVAVAGVAVSAVSKPE